MSVRLAYICLVLALCLGVGGAAIPASADEHLDYSKTIIFPWLPNGAMLGTMGPFYGAITVQNLEGSIAYLSVQADGLPPKTRVLPANGSLSMSAQEIGVPAPGAAVWVWARKADDSLARIAAVAKLSAPVPPEVPNLESRTSSAHQVVDGYTGLTEDDVSQVLVLPIVQTNSGWNTKIHVQYVCCGQAQEEVTFELRAAGGGAPLVTTRKLTLQYVTTVDLTADLGIPAGFVGSAIVRSDGPLLAMAERYKPSTNMLIINPARRRFDCDTPHHAPLVFNNYFSWNTGISIADVSGATNNVTVTTYRSDGSVAGTTNLVVPANGMNFVYTPATGGGEGYAGAAIIEGSGHLCAVVDEVKYTGDQPDVGHAMSYTGITFLALEDGTLALPLAQKGSPTTGHGDTTGIQLFNPGFEPINVNVKFWDQNGIVAQVVLDVIPAKQSRTVYAMGLADLPDGFQGSATINVHGGGGMVAAVSNNVNYAAQYDGSASFSLPRVVNYIY
jgi:hypothetical protein